MGLTPARNLGRNTSVMVDPSLFRSRVPKCAMAAPSFSATRFRGACWPRASWDGLALSSFLPRAQMLRLAHGVPDALVIEDALSLLALAAEEPREKVQRGEQMADLHQHNFARHLLREQQSRLRRTLVRCLAYSGAAASRGASASAGVAAGVLYQGIHPR